MSDDKPAVVIGEYERLELEEVFNRTRSLVNLRVQIYSFFGTANLTLLGIALGARQAGFLFVAAGLMGLLALVDRAMLHNQAKVAARGLELEQRYATQPAVALLHRLYALRPEHNLTTRLARFWLPLLLFTGEILFALICLVWLGWKW